MPLEKGKVQKTALADSNLACGMQYTTLRLLYVSANVVLLLKVPIQNYTRDFLLGFLPVRIVK